MNVLVSVMDCATSAMSPHQCISLDAMTLIN